MLRPHNTRCAIRNNARSPAHAQRCRDRRRHRGHLTCGRADRARLHGRHRARPRAAVHHRWIDIPRTRLGVPDQSVQDDERVRALHRREVRRPQPSRRLGVQPCRWSRGRDHRRALGGPAPQGGLGRGMGHRRLGCSRAAECVAKHPLLDRDRILGGFHTPRTVWRTPCAPPDPGAAGDCPRCDVPAAHRGARHRREGRPCHRRAYQRRRHRRRHRGVRGRILGRPVRQAGRPRRPTRADGTPVRAHRADRRAGRTQHRTGRGWSADPATSGSGPVFPRARRPHGHRVLQPQADARRHVHTDVRHRGRTDAVDAAVHRGRLRARMARGTPTASRTGRFEGRRGIQRHLLVHPGRLVHHG